jgi:hypothetical protein
MLVSRRPEPLWPTTSLVEWGCEGSGRRQSANSPAEQQRWSWSIRYGSILAGRIAVTEHIAGPRPGTVVPALAAGGRVMPTQAWLLGGPLGWIVAVTGGSPGRFMDGLGASGAVCPLGGVERPRRKERFARLMQWHGRVFGGPSVRAACGNLKPALAATRVIWEHRACHLRSCVADRPGQWGLTSRRWST